MAYKRILCGIDFSQASVGAFTAAVEQARAARAALHVLHCIEMLPMGSEDSVTAQEQARRAMEALVATVANADGMRLTTEITTGLPLVEILERARSSGVDLIVLGGTGVRLLEESVFGGTAEGVVKDAACSVLVVRGARET